MYFCLDFGLLVVALILKATHYKTHCTFSNKCV